ncbi:MAG: hypothetical protein C3F06_02500 [Candidatus Methanoperedenaceae archaeon]|nr:MAG: hypothetical protein C3F06_02500 [Candidatus Methanoperedenaceae archaeon]
MTYYLKIITQEQLQKLLIDHESGLDAEALDIKIPSVSKKFEWDNVHDKIKVGDKFAFYVREMGSIASYKATVSETFWRAKDAENTEKKGYWLHNFKFKDIEHILNTLATTEKDLIPSFRKIGNFGRVIQNCSMWELTEEDYKAMVGVPRA